MLSIPMLTDQPTQLSFAQLFDALPDGVLYFRAVRNGMDQELVDFVVDYVNPALRENEQRQDPAAVGTSVRYGGQPDSATTERQFAQLKAVVETGQPAGFEQYNQPLNEWVSVTQTKAGDGVLNITRIITAGKEALSAGQQSLLSSILNTSLNTTFVYAAIRDDAEQIQDFKVLLVNQRGRRDVMDRLGIDPVGKTLLGINPNSRQTGQFNLFCQVIKSGEPVQVEQYYPNVEQAWYNTAITKLNDGVVVTGIDITASKQAALENERQALDNKRQASFLHNILDASSNGIVAERAIRNAEGTIVDFLIISANRQAAEIVHSTVEALVGRSDLELHPELRSSGLFEAYVKTVETGESQFVETHYNDGRLDHWVEIRTRKLTDEELVITFSNVSDVKRTQQALEQAAADNKVQAELYDGVLAASINGIITYEAVRDQSTGAIVDFRSITINPVAQQQLNLPDAVPGWLLLNRFPTVRAYGFFDQYVGVVETGEPMRFATPYEADGLTGWYDVAVIRLGDGFVITFNEITANKHSQQAVERQAEENKRQASLLGSVLDSSNSGIIAFESIRNEQGTIIDFRFATINEASARILGVPLETMRGNTLLTLFPGNVDTGLFALYVKTAETGEPGRTETYYNYDGLDFWLDISAQQLGDGFVVTFTDVSVVKRAAKAVEQSAVELQTVIDTSQTGIFLFSPVRDETGEVVDFRFRVANRQLASYVGQAPAAVIGALGSRWFPDYQTNGLFEAYRKTYLTGETQRFDMHYEGSGIDVWLDIMATKMGDEVLVTFGDYTPLKKLQQQLEASVVDLQRSNANLEQFAYVASHDLQEPLRKIQAFGDIIETQYGAVLGEQGADMIRRMQLAAARMQLLIKDVLAYSRIAIRRDATRPVDLNQLVADVVDDLETAITGQGATVTVDPLPAVTGDAGQLRQLFQNLLSNALKFTKPAQTPGEIHPSEQPNARIVVTTQPIRGREAGMTMPPSDNDRLFHLIEVADNGIGFEPHQAGRIFQVFQRLHSRNDYQGTGIGLAIVKKVAENHNGHIEAVGRPGQGATFRILLPA